MEYDVFICHASEDKEAFVRPLALRLAQAGLRVWFDEFALRPGDSLRDSIDRGLRSSRTCVVVLSPRFIGRSWTEWELNGIVQRHLASEESILLPVWLDLSAAQVRQFSPSLADLVAVRAGTDISAVARTLAGLIRPPTLPNKVNGSEILENAMKALAESVSPQHSNQLRVSIRVLQQDDLLEVAAIGLGMGPLYNRIPISGSLSGLSLRREAPMVVSDLTSGVADPSQALVPNVPVIESIESIMVCPLVGLNGSAIGVISVASTMRDAFDDQSMERFKRLAAICGVLLERIMPTLRVASSA